ncbi:hypothetical protein ETB97_008748 [Aspergillus alliaceus]|uniref:Zn(2)-C6 fungal-type domain-containing protein n=1 Tax=Petromyces alliaceus TaxID=209559 RepID=A0A8H6EBT9_PETAA|nr:hypothetical protein ETB97_008748 [Aspergillus burnettii]
MASKVPIPKVPTAHEQHRPNRVRLACQNCREHKAKCSGHRPKCDRCQRVGLICSYPESQRQTIERQLAALTDQVHIYRDLLREICPRLDAASTRRVEDVLSTGTSDNNASLDNLLPTFSQSRSRDGPDSIHSKANPLESATDFTEEDFNRDGKAQATGFLGEHSSIFWLYWIKREAEQARLSMEDVCFTPHHQQNRQGFVNSVNYSLDDADLQLMDGIDALQVPPQQTADDLIQSYFEFAHPSFPIISRILFLTQYNTFYSRPHVRPGRKWLAVLNLVFAIAARYHQLVQWNNPGHESNHLLYFSRAWNLCLSDSLTGHPDPQQVQVEGLASFYLISAIAMGLHLRNENSGIPVVSKENRYFVWWSLYTLGITLSIVTGRGPSINYHFMTTPLPIPFQDQMLWDIDSLSLIKDYRALGQLTRPQELNDQGNDVSECAATTLPAVDSVFASFDRSSVGQTPQGGRKIAPNESLYFLYFVELTLFTQESIGSLYAPAAVRRPWPNREAFIIINNKKVETWSHQLPPEYQFQRIEPGQAHVRQSVSLAFCYYSCKILLLQPCLRRLSNHSSEACKSLAASCVEAASLMLRLLPDHPDTSWLYTVAPWWCALHYIMQSTSVLLMKLCKLGADGPDPSETVRSSVRKALYWLREMSARDPSAERAWQICSKTNLLENVEHDTKGHYGLAIEVS